MKIGFPITIYYGFAKKKQNKIVSLSFEIFRINVGSYTLALRLFWLIRELMLIILLNICVRLNFFLITDRTCNLYHRFFFKSYYGKIMKETRIKF